MPEENEAPLDLETQHFRLAGLPVVSGAPQGRTDAPLGALGFREPWDSLYRLTPARIYAMAWHPSAERPLLFSGDKDGGLGILDLLKARSDREAGCSAVRPCKETISNLRFGHDAALYLSSYDGTIRCFDLHQQAIAVAHHAPGEFVTGLDVSSGGQLLYYGTGSGRVGIWDSRCRAACTFQLHEKKTQCVSVSHQQPHSFCTSSLDNSVCIWDARALSDVSGSAPARRLSHRRSVTSAYFHRQHASLLVTTCYDDYVRLYRNVLSEDTADADAAIHHNNQTGKWITTFKAVWDDRPGGDPFFCIGDMQRSLTIFDGSTGAPQHQLRCSALTAQPAVNAVHPGSLLVASGTASGKVAIWS